VPALFVAILFVPVEAWELVESSGSSGTGSSRRYSTSVGPYPDVLCGCTTLLKNFA
jgi:hypothetical protein